ncbi:maleylpyruvate isomerase N-terminal domain-containing protein [Candidatus Poriferisodalis sp.]|uniref:maleylpyruvate isomerase N-terminal domain-containing protein n=1 Tax=Candidatus Poriferisodalis sp. TaxID=3101277 RepID=UPI003C705135
MTPAANPSIDSARVRALVVEAVTQAAELLAAPSTAEQWDQPSALEGMTVGALCAHLVRAAGATIAYLDRTPPDRRPDADLLTAVTYFHAAVDSPIHDQIKDVSAAESAIGHEATVEKCRQLAADLETRLAAEPTDRLVAALGGRLLTLDDFCRTRLIEVLLHLDDLAVSTGQTRPATDPLGPAIIIEICMNIARDRNGDWGVLYALTRAERSSDTAVFPVF